MPEDIVSTPATAHPTVALQSGHDLRSIGFQPGPSMRKYMRMTCRAQPRAGSHAARYGEAILPALARCSCGVLERNQIVPIYTQIVPI